MAKDDKKDLARISAEPAPAASPSTPPIELEQLLLRELDEATQDTYTVFSDRLSEKGELRATPWHGLNETHKHAWRCAVKYVRDQEASEDVSR